MNRDTIRHRPVIVLCDLWTPRLRKEVPEHLANSLVLQAPAKRRGPLVEVDDSPLTVEREKRVGDAFEDVRDPLPGGFGLRAFRALQRLRGDQLLMALVLGEVCEHRSYAARR